jgi:hypothetical protein
MAFFVELGWCLMLKENKILTLKCLGDIGVYYYYIYNIIKWPALKPPQKKKKTSRGRERVRVEVMAIIIQYIDIYYRIIIYQTKYWPALNRPGKQDFKGGG